MPRAHPGSEAGLVAGGALKPWSLGALEPWEVRLMFGEPWRAQLPVHHPRPPASHAAWLPGYLHGLSACASRICSGSQPVASPATPRTNTNAPPTTESDHPRSRYGTQPSAASTEGSTLHAAGHDKRL